MPRWGVAHQPKHPPRTFRIPEEPYRLAQAKARAEGTTLTALVNEWIWEYVYGDDDSGL
jgi:hypothetical protein